MKKESPNPFEYATDTVCGIDYSLRTPALCVIPATSLNDTIVPFDSCEFYYLTQVKRDVIDHKNVHGMLIGDWDSPETRYETLAEWVLDVLKKHECKTVGIEDYAFRASNQSALTQLAENCGLLKYFLHQNAIDYSLYSPSALKKFATGNGRSLKAQVYDAWLKDTKVCLQSIWGRDPDAKPRSPVTDICDAYYCACSHRIDMVQTNYAYAKGKERKDERDIGHTSS